jgi:hypothetical protein
MTKKEAYPLLTSLLLMICLLTNSILYAQNKQIDQTISGFVYNSTTGQALQNNYGFASTTNEDKCRRKICI